MGGRGIEGYESFSAMRMGPVKELPSELQADLTMTATAPLHPLLFKDPQKFVPTPFMPRPKSWHGAEAMLIALAKHRGFTKRGGILSASGAPSFKQLVAFYFQTGRIPGTVVVPPGAAHFVFELRIRRTSTGEVFKLPCFRVATFSGGQPVEGAPLGDSDAVSLTAAGVNWQMFLWHKEKAVELWASRLAAWPFYTASVLLAAMALEAYLNEEAERYLKRDDGKVPVDVAQELREAVKYYGLTYKVENWPQKWGANALRPGTTLHRDVMWMIELRNGLVHPKDNWVGLRDSDKNTLAKIHKVLEDVIRHWSFSLPAALPNWLTRVCMVRFDKSTGDSKE